jgi:allantoicase
MSHSLEGATGQRRVGDATEQHRTTLMKMQIRGAAAGDSIPSFTQLADLASARVGGRAVATNDDFFASKSNLVKAEPAIFIPGKYTTRGKWMDGWESRRRRTPGHDWCIVQLGMRGRVRGVDVDTSFFTGNYPTHCSIDAVDASGNFRLKAEATTTNTKREAEKSKGVASAFRRKDYDNLPWTEILPKTELDGDSHNFIPIISDQPWTHLRLNIYPDGGVARLRVYGDVVVDWTKLSKSDRPVDLAAIWNAGLVIAASDVHYGATGNMLMPGRAKNMGDGWETKRRRGPGHDWAIVRLGTPGTLSKLEIDTNHFKGNYPDSASVEGCMWPDASLDQLDRATWFEVLRQTKLRPHGRHLISRELSHRGPVSHLRLNIFPDGGISRFRVHGTPAR